MANSADADQLVQKPTDLDLHSLQRQDIAWQGLSLVYVRIQHDKG